MLFSYSICLSLLNSKISVIFVGYIILYFIFFIAFALVLFMQVVLSLFVFACFDLLLILFQNK